MRTVYKDCHSNNNTINFIQIYMLFIWGCTPHDLPLDKHVASGEPVLLRAASVASPIKLTICFYSSMRSHSFAVAAVNKNEAHFCSYIFLGFGTAHFCWEIYSCDQPLRLQYWELLGLGKKASNRERSCTVFSKLGLYEEKKNSSNK